MLKYTWKSTSKIKCALQSSNSLLFKTGHSWKSSELCWLFLWNKECVTPSLSWILLCASDSRIVASLLWAMSRQADPNAAQILPTSHCCKRYLHTPFSQKPIFIHCLLHWQLRIPVTLMELCKEKQMWDVWGEKMRWKISCQKIDSFIFFHVFSGTRIFPCKGNLCFDP